MLIIKKIFISALILFILPTATIASSKTKKSLVLTLSEKNLSQLINKQDTFFKNSQNSPKFSEKEMTRQAQEIVAAYEDHLSKNPKDVHGLILFGKFLNRVGQKTHATEYFMKADMLNPKIAVVKQQLANYLVEQGRPVDAFPYFILTIELNPKEAVYHYHLGNFLFIFQKELSDAGILNKSSVLSFMHRSFKESTNLNPNHFDFYLRYAQSFFDFPDSDKNTALKIWSEIEHKFPNRSKLEKDYFCLCRARILLDLNRQKKHQL